MGELEEPMAESIKKMAGDSTTEFSSPSPNKRLKTLSKSIIEDEPGNHQPEQQRQQQAADDDDSDPEICGICLSDGGRRAIRGKINSCDHFFCFVCIMEWAKVESRCPMCKRRFTIIHRPPKEGVFASQRLVNIPQRDQVYHLSGNATSGPSDPYSEVKCSVCHGMTDESLLLLCDLCDSAAHTYCVGLGATVPDGDWFCHDCALSRSEHGKTDVDTETDNHMIAANYNVQLPSEEDVSIFDIVRDSNITPLEGHNASVSSCSNHSPPSIIPGWESSGADEVSRPSRNTVGKLTESGARTLRRCRNVQSRIQVLRENWCALQSRSLSFSSRMAESGGGSHGKGKVAAVCNPGSSESQPSISTSQHSTSQDSSIQPKEDLYDIDKAWKMMSIAKSMQKNCKTTNSLNRNSTKLPCLGSASKEAIRSSSLHILKIQQNETRNEERMGKQKQYGYHCHKREKEKCKSPEMEKQKRVVINTQPSERVPASHSLHFFPPSSSAKVQIENGCSRVNDLGPFVKIAQSRRRESSSTANTERGSCSTSLFGSVLRGSMDSLDSNLEAGVTKLDLPEGRTRLEKSCSKSKDRKDDNIESEIQALAKLNSGRSLDSNLEAGVNKLDIPEVRTRLEKSCSKSKDRKDDNAKSEIQALVKLNLKLLSQDKRLGVNIFKEIARLATHTILAAYGFQHSKSSIHSFPSPVCSHSNDINLQQKSTLMPNSCRECFYVFVKNVVSSIMVEKGLARSS
ncbi:uncharacterized protein LOC108457803 [Gossypium arboreum]|nr:uncharacterized protein LOC108457803 [Gossypium arboreum]